MRSWLVLSITFIIFIVFYKQLDKITTKINHVKTFVISIQEFLKIVRYFDAILNWTQTTVQIKKLWKISTIFQENWKYLYSFMTILYIYIIYEGVY